MFLFLGIVLADPEIPLDATLIPSPSPRPKNPVFEDEKKSKVRETILGYCVNAALTAINSCFHFSRLCYGYRLFGII